MDNMFPKDRDFDDDVERFRIVDEESIPAPNSSAKLANTFQAKVSTGLDLSVKGGNGDNLGSTTKYGDEVCRENVEVVIDIENKVAADVLEKKTEKEKHKSVTAKKPPKPPRPPRGFSLDAADQKLIKELAELAAIKRAKIERIKALKKMKAARASSSSSGSLFAMLCTGIFCVVIICQGMSSGNNAAVSFRSSLVSAGPSNSSLIAVQEPMSLSVIAKNSTYSEPPNLIKHASGLDTEKFWKVAIRRMKVD